jgi:DNA-binding NarL/FixJ family response regulator
VFVLAANVALTHHERVDGRGYPRGLSGTSIPIEGRIAAVADVFDALTHDRVYRPAYEAGQALELLRDGRGSQFDETVLDAFESVLPEVLDTSRRYPDSRDAGPPSCDADPDQPIRVLIVEHRQASPNGLTLLLRSEGIEIAGSAQNLAQARRLIARRRPDVAIVDVDLAGERGLDLLPEARTLGTRVLFYGNERSVGLTRAAKAAGAGGIASKGSASYELLDAVCRVNRGEWCADPRVDQGRVAAEPVPELTPREREISALLAAGLTGEQIAVRLFLSPATVRTHIRNAMNRVGAKTRVHLVARAAARNEIELLDRPGPRD